MHIIRTFDVSERNMGENIGYKYSIHITELGINEIKAFAEAEMID